MLALQHRGCEVRIRVFPRSDVPTFVRVAPRLLLTQGNDYGTQYRSAIYTHDDAQHAEALAYIQAAQPHFSAPIVTTVERAPTFYPAEEKHQRYYDKNPDAGYCRAVVRAKVQKARSSFPDLLK